MDWRSRAREAFKLVWLDTRSEWRTRRTHRGRKKPVKTQMQGMDRRLLFLLFAKLEGHSIKLIYQSPWIIYEEMYKKWSNFFPESLILTRQHYFKNPINSLFLVFHVTVHLRIGEWINLRIKNSEKWDFLNPS